MDKINPEISVFTAMPNNGYLAIVFHDSGLAMSASCSKKDAYEGLLEACSQFLLDCIDDKRPNFNTFSGEEPTPEEAAQIEKYAGLVATIHGTFCKELKRRLTIGSTTRQLEDAGVPHVFAKMLATGMEGIPGRFEQVFEDDGCDEEDPDDSDDEFNPD